MIPINTSIKETREAYFKFYLKVNIMRVVGKGKLSCYVYINLSERRGQ